MAFPILLPFQKDPSPASYCPSLSLLRHVVKPSVVMILVSSTLSTHICDDSKILKKPSAAHFVVSWNRWHRMVLGQLVQINEIHCAWMTHEVLSRYMVMSRHFLLTVFVHWAVKHTCWHPKITQIVEWWLLDISNLNHFRDFLKSLFWQFKSLL